MSKQLFILPALAASLAVSSPARSLDIGIEAELRLEASDNVDQIDDSVGDEGTVGFASFEVYGEQRGQFLRGGFLGELQTRQEFDTDDNDTSTVNNFFGGATLQLTPSLSWYFGDVLGSVRVSDGIIPTEDDEIAVRRNVFVTGPTLNFEVDSRRRFNAELLYFNQSQDDIDLAQLFTAQADFSFDTSGGNTFGIALSDIYTDEPNEPVGELVADDNNRVSAALFWRRDRGRFSYSAEVGATRFDADGDAITGLNAAFRVSRQLSPVSSLVFAIGTDLSDQNISTIDSLLDDGAGTQTEAPGIFQSNIASIIYNFAGSRTTAQLGASVEDSAFRTLETLIDGTDPSLEDSTIIALFGSLSRTFTRRLSLNAGLRYENEQFDNLDDESDSVAADITVDFRLTQSFIIGAGVRSSYSTGTNTREFISVAADGNFDVTENRGVLLLRYAPPSRATREPVVQLRQLLR